ncbi:MAG: sigma-54-dependent Fis family transcriptional regulator [Candidatus Glassbacteria bacterium]|nr:sigma-54-dependent Fis family transcriptional regulator [Candidatus Glassbacteria bacterium]
MMGNNKILIVDDDPNIRYAFVKTFEAEKVSVLQAQNGKEAIQVLKNENPQVIFLDYSMPELDGFGVMETMKEQEIDIPTIMITGVGTMQTAIKAVQLGAYEYITKPLDVDKIRILAHRAIEVFHLKERVKGLESTIQSFPQQYELVGNHPLMQEIYKKIGAVTGTPNSTNILINGESGTGKELVARAIHSHGPNRDQPFIAINCTVLPESLMESEIFGHEKGAFTGAVEKRLGKFEVAQGGTIFLDEIGDLSPNLQQKLLRVIQERNFERLGSNTSIPVEARFITSTNQDLPKAIVEGSFREDLFYRLNAITIHLPPLRERKADIPLLSNVFLQRYTDQMDNNIVDIDPKVKDLLVQYDYPGNVRELENIIKGAAMLEKSGLLRPGSLPQHIYDSPERARFVFPVKSMNWRDARRQMIQQFEKQFVTELLQQSRGNVTQAAHVAGIERQSFQRIMKKHHLFSADFKH